MKSAITLAAALFLAVPAMAVEDEHAGHHPGPDVATAAPPSDQRMQEMQARMQEMRDATDPEVRERLMDEQMGAMESMLEHMQGMGGAKEGAGMGAMGKHGMGHGMMQRGPGAGMGPGMMQRGPGGEMGPGMMQRGPGGGMDPAMMQQRHEMMQQRQAMMQQRHEMMQRCMEMMQRDMAPPGASGGHEGH